MTRFARAKGSKASNERVPETPTPWNVMKGDLQKSQNEAKNKKERQKIHQERQKNYDEFVKETEDKKEKKWAEFPKTNLKTIKKKPKKNKNLSKLTEKDVTNDMIDELCHSDPEVDGKLKNMTKKIEQVLGQEKGGKKSKKKQQKKNIAQKKEDDDDNDAPEEASTKQEPKKINIKKAKNKKQPLKIPLVAKNGDTPKPEVKKSPKNFKNKKQLLKIPLVAKNGDTTEPEIKQSPKNFKNKKQNQDDNKKGKFEKKNNFDKNQHGQKRKLPKIRDDKEHKRRKPLESTVKVLGETKEIVLLHGFPILKSDNDRIQELRKTLISKSVPKSEVQRTIKLERRKAEKSLLKIKKSVCFKCRESGHILSECPELENSQSLIETAATGICFKCGSTEHSSKSCKMGNNYKFAKCFICREQGHISSQCPDNPKGLYPKGGACKLCGDVTHLKKDCPKYQDEQKSNAVFLETISSGNIEDVEESAVENKKKVKPEKKKKVVKF